MSTNIFDEEEYKRMRVRQLTESGIQLYPHKFNVDTTVKKFLEIYKNSTFANNERVKDKRHSLAGRVKHLRHLGNKLMFFRIISDGYEVQLLADMREFEDESNFKLMKKVISRGDIIGATGFVGMSNTGELSLYPTSLVHLSLCKKMLPLEDHVHDAETLVRNRPLYYISSTKNVKVLKLRATIINEIRQYLHENDFTEVETPVLWHQAGGATAKPFKTHHNDLDQDMYMRIAPELFLKQLVIGGLDRVFEIGKQFRNEGADPTHNPEFTSLEFYMAYADYNDLMSMAETLLSRVVYKVHGQYKFNFVKMNGSEVEIDFTPPYAKYDITTELKNRANIELPSDLYSEESRQYLINKCNELGVHCSPPQTTARLLDKLIGEYIEPLCVNPSFIINHPLVMSPLAKVHRTNSSLSERFELFVCGNELCNAYTELNDPEVQRHRFMEQLKDRQKGDDEAQPPDEDFCQALDYGLPPTGGFGLGIDRFIMFLTNNASIRDVITFPAIGKKN